MHRHAHYNLSDDGLQYTTFQNLRNTIISLCVSTYINKQQKNQLHNLKKNTMRVYKEVIEYINQKNWYSRPSPSLFR